MAHRAVVVDTNIIGASLRPGKTEPWDQALEAIDGAPILISFATAAELRFGARLAGWGERRLATLDERLSSVMVVWPGPALINTYVELRTWATQTGHGMADKRHEADRWIAATALRLDVPLASHDQIFHGVEGLAVLEG